MDTVQLKIQNNGPLAKYIKIIRKFDDTLSVSEIKQRIENNEFVTEFYPYHYDISDEFQGVDRKIIFRDMINELSAVGANVSVYIDGKLSSAETLDKQMKIMTEIMKDVEADIDRETI